MASTYENDLRLEEMATGENSGSWGTKTNNNLELVADAFSYGTEIIANADTAITIADGVADAARSLALKITSSEDLTTTRVITLGPSTVSKVWIIENSTSGGQTLTISAGSGSNITLANGTTKIIATDGIGAGSNVVELTQDLAIADLFVDDDLTVGDDIIMNSDGAKIDFGSNSEIQLTHVADTGLLLTETGGGAPTLQFRDSALAISSSADGKLDIDSDGTIDINATTSIAFDTNTLYVDSANNRVGMGSTSPQERLLVNEASDTIGVTLAGTANAATTAVTGGLGFRNLFSATTGHLATITTKTGSGTALGDLIFSTSSASNTPSSAMIINSSQEVLINKTTASDVGSTASAKLQINAESIIGLTILTTAVGTGPGGTIALGHGRGDATTALQEDDIAGEIRFSAADGTDLENQVANIKGMVDGAVSTNDTPGRLVFSTAPSGAGTSTEAMRVNSSQRVLIGGDTDFAVAGRERLLVEHTDGGGISMRRLDSSVVADDTLGRLNFYGSDGASVGNDGIGAAIVAKAAGTFAADDFPTNLGFFNNVDNSQNLVENLTIRYDGHVGINDTSPSTILSVKDDNTIVQIAANGGTAQSYFIVNSNRDSATQHLAELIGQWNGTSVGRIVIAAGDDATNKDDGKITFYTAPSGSMTLRMVISSNGNVGIGSDLGIDPVNPSSFGTALEIGDNDGGSLVLTDTNTTTNKKSFFMASKSTKFYLGTMNDDGTSDAGVLFLDHTTQHVGIGTDAPDTKFEIYDDTTWDTATFKSNTGTGAGLTMHATSTGVEWSLIAQGTTGGADDNNLGFHLTGAGTSGQPAGYKFAMNASGDFKIFNGNLNMATAGTGIDFSAQTATSASGATTNSEILDHYEEGEWTPILKGQTTAGSASYTSRVGYFTRIGNIVQIHFTIAANAFTGTGALIVAGLPFNVSGASVDSVFSMQWNSAQWSGPSSTKQTVIPMIYSTSSDKIGFRASDYQSGVNFAQVNCIGSSSTISYMRVTGWYRLGTT